MSAIFKAALGAVFLGAFLHPAAAQSEESVDYFKRWLERDVVYIISAEERDVFEKLTTDEEKTRFIEQFWKSRDLDPATQANEFREEHYRRIAYANENFAAGKPGWKTDRGMIYIKFGPPDRRQTNPTGGRYYRTKQELIAAATPNPEQHMTALPFEVWEYRYLEGLGQEVVFEFVSKEGGPDYKLALHADEKDALFFNTGSHLPKLRDRNRGLKTFKANPLDRVEGLAAAQRPLPAHPPQEFVSAQVHFSELPFSIETLVEPGPAGGRGEGREDRAACSVGVLIPHSSLSFDRRLDKYRARVDVEIFIRDIRKLVVAHQADQVETLLGKDELMRARRDSSRYSADFFLPPGRYLVEVWIKDILGNAASFDSSLLIVPKQASN